MTKIGMMVKKKGLKMSSLLFLADISKLRILIDLLPPPPPRRELFAEKNRKIMLNYSENMSCTAKENTKAHFTIKQQKN